MGLVLAAATVAFAAPSLAQFAELSMSTSSDSLEVAPNESGVSTIVVENTGSSDGTVQLTADSDATGWSLALGQEEVTVAAGGSEEVDLTVQAPVDRAGGPESMTATVAGSMQDASGQFTSSDQVEVQAAMPPVPPAPPEDTPWGWIAGASGIVIAGLAGAVWYVRRDTSIPSQVEVEIEQTGRVRPGGEEALAVSLANNAEDERRASLSLEAVPEDWGGGLNRQDIVLQPGDEDRVWVALKAPESASEGTHEIGLTVTFAGELVLPEQTTFLVEVDEEALDGEDPSRTLIAPVGARPVDGARSQHLSEDE